MMPEERPIVLSGERVRAVLDGRKLRITTVVKPQPVLEDSYYEFYTWNCKRPRYSFCGNIHALRETLVRCSPYKIGDRLWVRETWFRQIDNDGKWLFPDATKPQPIHYAADGNLDSLEDYRKCPSIHMPRWASRITLEVTDVRAERLQDITEGDAKAEGVNEMVVLPGDRGSYVSSFAYLWDSINAKRGFSWEANPWVWVVEFKMV